MKLRSLSIFSFLIYAIISLTWPSQAPQKIDGISPTQEQEIKSIFIKAHLESSLSFDLFRRAMVGFYHLNGLKIRDKITIVDYSKPSTEERFYVIDLAKKKLLYKCLVAHGVNSGNTQHRARRFSNMPDSKKTSLGFYQTAETYMGKNGFSCRLDGLEKGINDNARKRAIVLHGSDYAEPEYIKKYKTLGRSWGCPALPKTISKEIIQLIAQGSCLFIYAEDENYLKKSAYMEFKI